MSKHATISGFLFLLCMVSSFSQDGNITVKGTVLDQETNDPLEYATLVLQSVDDPEKITGGITDAEGKFNVSAEPGKYHIRIEYISYKPYIMPDRDLNNSVDLGVVRLAIDATQLDAVEVVGEKTTVEVRLDKKIYNIGKDITTS